MNEPRISITIRPDLNGFFSTGETLNGEFSIHDLVASEIATIELSILWYTEGKGEEELGVHYFERIVPAQVAGFDSAVARPFNAKLPASPLSYDGLIVNIRWCVRVRVFLHRGRDVLAERTFRLGQIPPAQAVASVAKLGGDSAEKRRDGGTPALERSA